MRKLLILNVVGLEILISLAFQNDFLVSKLGKCCELKTFQSLSKLSIFRHDK